MEARKVGRGSGFAATASLSAVRHALDGMRCHHSSSVACFPWHAPHQTPPLSLPLPLPLPGA